ncbi:DUF6600 domain-containing protein [Flavobacterium sp. H122]|uniref:DUF6600 domain-containing protein n=1 Tax=Flavobacterium sp. H122 TaxID=2529860 RepID=UPI0010AAD5FD|nr:DUF6600 domain-containing protein [Flavobacterium sp. H122]
MKTIQKAVLLLLLIAGMMGTTSQKATAQVSVSFQMFYDNLSVYGSWISDPNYGYVWSPKVGAGFAPYRTNGYWILTDYGWTWVSNYSWGWAPFHYGRWFYDPYYGWLWVPDTIWAPAWVTWRYCDGYYGWAAIGPNISISIGSTYSVPYNQWVFVRERDFGRRNINNYYVSTSNNRTIIGKSVVINNIKTNNGNRYYAGPERNHVQKRTGNAVTHFGLRERNSPGQKLSQTELQLYKPRVERSNKGKKAFPAIVTDRKSSNQNRERRVEQKMNNEERQMPQRNERRIEQPQRQNNEPMRKMPQHRQPEMQQNNPQERNQERRQYNQQAEPRRMEPSSQRKEMPQRRNENSRRPVKQNHENNPH